MFKGSFYFLWTDVKKPLLIFTSLYTFFTLLTVLVFASVTSWEYTRIFHTVPVFIFLSIFGSRFLKDSFQPLLRLGCSRSAFFQYGLVFIIFLTVLFTFIDTSLYYLVYFAIDVFQIENIQIFHFSEFLQLDSSFLLQAFLNFTLFTFIVVISLFFNSFMYRFGMGLFWGMVLLSTFLFVIPVVRNEAWELVKLFFSESAILYWSLLWAVTAGLFFVVWGMMRSFRYRLGRL